MVSNTDDRRRLLLDAARELLLEEQYDLLAGITLERVAERAGVPTRTAKRDFTIGELRKALTEDLLRVRPSEDLDEAAFAEFTGRLTDRNRPIGEEIGLIVDLIVQHNVENDLFRSMMAFWGLSAHDPDVQNRIARMYEQWLRDARDGLNAMFMQHLDAMPMRKDWITVEDFVRAMTAIVEGLAVQLTLDPGDRPQTDLRAGVPPMDPELPRKVAQALLSSMIDHEGVPSTDEVFDIIEQRR